jgi:hypothetical protein
MIEELKKYNEFYYQNCSHGDKALSCIFKFEDRGTKLILTAPHSTRSFINKQERFSDLYTGAITEYVGKNTNTSTIIRQKYTPYKALISDFIGNNNLQEHYFLDIHGFEKDIAYDVCLGIGEMDKDSYPYLQEIVQTIQSFDLRVAINHENYMGLRGLTGRYQRTYNKPNVIQMEMRRHLRDLYNNPENVQKITIPMLMKITDLYRL